MGISQSIFDLNIFKFSVVVLDLINKGTVSQIILLGPRSNKMQSRKLRFLKMQKVSRFWS